MEKRLYRNRSERMIWGVCGGLANYFDMDPTIVRIIFVLLALTNGVGIVVYIIMAIVVPLEGSKVATSKEVIKENVEEIKETAGQIGNEIRSTFEKADEEDTSGKIRRRRNLLGMALIVIGIVILLGTLNLFHWLNWVYIWPVIIIAVGLIIVFSARRKR